jgi:K+-sensing histidine kinase KdpD
MAVGSRWLVHVRRAALRFWQLLPDIDGGFHTETKKQVGSSSRINHEVNAPDHVGKTPLGMFHCKMIVEAHRGGIEVESQSGKGSAFRVLLPLETKSLA